ncbi:efflux RND transporter periplasmic adaptor subunit [Helicobacter winghamensis]|uniref:Efflux transporter periplasmic adaptor subunit n=1 Tax=Helicobacter winghamensis TaxID=157268 RepID=A0A2N3PI46_9HELI|nr:efflux RND transporter periplasmic adaptor subunit [Helicobacter winghamensis]EEO26114.1 efflux transporter, RND family, MFP subunit [Helicobacter winghamensis ATCC BAA-430]PKT75746.1 efflux transporter periplasmic adaptor subunit [Helicobacter winghamensis]PKT75955.1 efflux transporter periplasmic adaptor subunit [Helicobacter winghamensis]PKT76192.1 efflux transporter periplasmic adaptor subunit [Helicobacter winghamensis]PKT80338.1 efflux transporter periplasmic adaptor subunit [Helicoba
MQTPKEILNTLNPKRNYKKLFIIISSTALSALLLIMLLFWLKNKEPNYTYTTQPAKIGDIQTSISANGTLSPTHEVSIGSVISGIVLEVLVDVNDEVSKGQILAKIDSESIEQNLLRLEAQLASAKAQLKSAQVNLDEKKWQYQQLQTLHQKTQGKTPSKLDLQSAKTAYNAALSEVGIKEASITEIETSIRSTQVDLKNAHITTPIDGVVLSRSIEVGQSVAASFQAPEFFIIAESLEEMELNVSISEADIGKVAIGQEVHFSVDSYPNKTFSAKVDRVNFGANESTDNIVSYEARISVDNKDLLLRPGMSATADITTKSVKNALLIPASALYFSPSTQEIKKQKSSFNPFGSMRRPKSNTTQKQANSSVWILENKIPKEIPIEVGISDGIFTQIFSDSITQGTEIILSQRIEK